MMAPPSPLVPGFATPTSARWTRAVLVAALACGWGAASLRAELTWKQKTVEIDADAKATVLEARFPFANEGTTPVDIAQIKPGCGCTTTTLEKLHYDPGQGGEIVVRYELGENIGVQKKSILVTTSDQPEATMLMIVARIPELLHLPETFVNWKSGEAAEPKVLQLVAAPHTVALENLSVQASNTAVSAVVQPAADGSGYEVQITPKTTDKAAFVTLIVRWRLGTEEKIFRAYATVDQPSSPSRRAAPATTPRPPAEPSPAPAG